MYILIAIQQEYKTAGPLTINDSSGPLSINGTLLNWYKLDYPVHIYVPKETKKSNQKFAVFRPTVLIKYSVFKSS